MVSKIRRNQNPIEFNKTPLKNSAYDKNKSTRSSNDFMGKNYFQRAHNNSSMPQTSSLNREEINNKLNNMRNSMAAIIKTSNTIEQPLK